MKYKLIMKEEEVKKILKLAGKLALNADLVVKSNAQNISERISKLENALHKMGAKAHSSLFSVGGMKATSPVKC